MRIKLAKTYINHDIRQIIHRYVQSRLDDDEAKTNARIDESTSDEQLLQRYCYTGVGKLCTIMRKILVVTDYDSDDTLHNKDTWQFEFKRSVVDAEGLAALMHWFIVRFAIWQWLSIHMPQESAMAKAELDDVEKDLNRSVGRLAMPAKVHRPFEDDDLVITYEPL